MYSVAADDSGVYHHTGYKMVRINPGTGVIDVDIEDPEGEWAGYAKHDAPVLLGNNLVGAYTGTASSGRASANQEHRTPRTYTVFDMTSKTILWRSARKYLVQPAFDGTYLYLAGNSPATLDALNPSTGQVEWSWTLPEEWSDDEFHRNIVVTDNVLFVSTDRQTIGIDLQSREVVFTHSKPGLVSISDDRMLFIATGQPVGDGGLVAFSGL